MDRCIFRGKRLDNGEWMQGDSVTYENGTRAIRDPATWLTKNVDPATVVQSIGLHDKNGKESYHKDIVLTNAGYVGVIEFGSHSPTGNDQDNSWGWFIQCTDGSQITVDEDFGSWGEVVGNIYDNPELL